MKGRNWLLNPKPEWLFWRVLNKKREVALYYLIGILFIITGAILIIQRLLELGGILSASAVPVSPLDIEQPTTETRLDILARNIIIYLNILFASLGFLISIRLKRFGNGEPPRWIRNMLENDKIVLVLYFIFGTLALYSTVRVTPYIRELGQGLGYW